MFDFFKRSRKFIGGKNKTPSSHSPIPLALRRLKESGGLKLMSKLSDAEIITLHNTGQVVTVPAGRRFIEQGKEEQVFYIIIKGKVRIVKDYLDQQIELSFLGEGDCVGEIAFVRRAKRVASAYAAEPTTLMMFDQKRLKLIPPQLRLKINEFLLELSYYREEDISKREVVLNNKNSVLISQFTDKILAPSVHYRDSEMIKGIIESIPTLPLYVNELLSQLIDYGASKDEVIRNIEKDPSLVAILLRRVNSAFFNLEQKVDNIQHALMLLGYAQVYDLVLESGVKKSMPNDAEFQQLQEHSFGMSVIAYEIALLCCPKRAMLCSTLGILHDIGKSVLLLLERKYPTLNTVISLIDPNQVGAMLLSAWNLPERITQVLEYQDYPRYIAIDRIPGEIREDVVVLHVAHLCVEFLEGKRREEVPELCFDDYIQALTGQKEETVLSFLKHKLVPGLRKRKENLPESLRKLL